MMDYAMLPPEVNSGRMYTGAGSGPMMAAASAWDQLATMLSSAANSYRAVVSGLVDGPWQGPASASMATAAEPYMEWMTSTAAQAEQTAGQARAAAAAYEVAFTATVPPPAIAANRSTLATLVATNFFGQNTPAIAANQAEYAGMWAQDASAMYAYTASSANAMTLTPVSPAPQTTDPAGSASQSAAQSTANSSAATAGQTLSSILDWNPFGAIANSPLLDNSTVSGLNGLLNATGALTLQSAGPFILSEGAQIFLIPLYTATGKLAMLGPMAAMGAATGAGLTSSVTASPGAAAGVLAGSAQPGVSAGVGTGMPVGKLTVPPTWGMTPQEVRLTATASSAATPSAISAASAPSAAPMAAGTPMAPPVMGGPIGGVVNAPRNGDPRIKSPSSLTVTGGQPGAENTGTGQWAEGSAAGESGLSKREEDELEKLRDEMSNLAMECDAVARLMREAMR